jgi:hypothetical protein
MKIIEKKLDKAYQELSKGKPCFYCGKPAKEVHHIVSRAKKAHRWTRANGVCVCRKCHISIHSGVLPNLEPDFKVYDYKDFLKKFQLSEKEYLKEKCEEFGIDFKDEDLNRSTTLKPELKEKIKQIQKESYNFKKKFINQKRARL